MSDRKAAQTNDGHLGYTDTLIDDEQHILLKIAQLICYLATLDE